MGDCGWIEYGVPAIMAVFAIISNIITAWCTYCYVGKPGNECSERIAAAAEKADSGASTPQHQQSTVIQFGPHAVPFSEGLRSTPPPSANHSIASSDPFAEHTAEMHQRLYALGYHTSSLELYEKGETHMMNFLTDIERKREANLISQQDAVALLDARKAGSGWSVLHMACGAGRTKVVATLLQLGVSTEIQTTSGATPLMIACRDGRYETVKLLCERGAHSKQKDAFNNTPLCYAVEKEHLSIVRYLVEVVRVPITTHDPDVVSLANWNPSLAEYLRQQLKRRTPHERHPELAS